MKVFQFQTTEPYSGGCIIVAAESEEQAYEILSKEREYEAKYTGIDNCFEIKSLYSNFEKPGLVCGEFYIE